MLKRVINVTTLYIKRKFLTLAKRDFTIVDITDSKIIRITNDTPCDSIRSILGNDFADFVNLYLWPVEKLIQIDPDTVLTTTKLKLGAFTYFWGLYNNKIICGKLDELPKDALVTPVRNLKRKYGKIIKAINKPNEDTSLVFIDEYNNQIPYPHTGNNTKTLLIGPKYLLFLSCNPCWDMEEYVQHINKYLVDNPSYLIQLDNGRYEEYLLENIDKDKWISVAFNEYDGMFVFGESK